jgi:prepilin-type N-terminal cleavage/methylation domain-containing protein
MIRRQKLQSRRGWTLVEMIVVMMLLSVLLSLLGTLLWGVFRIQAAATASFEQLQLEATLVDRFRADVAGARAAPEFDGDFQASPLCMIFRKEDDALILYRFKGNVLERSELRDEESPVEEFRLAGEDSVAEFGRQGRLLTLTLRGPRRGTLSAAAALGGDRP